MIVRRAHLSQIAGIAPHGRSVRLGGGRSTLGRRTVSGFLRRIFHKPEAGTDLWTRTAQLREGIKQQDPHGRITFFPAGLLDNALSLKHRVLGAVPSGFQSELEIDGIELLPFWHVALIGDARYHVAAAMTRYKRVKGGKGLLELHPSEPYKSIHGFASCAVHEDHWAHGVVLSDNIMRLVPEGVLPDVKNGVGQYSDALEAFDESKRLESYSQSFAPPFAYGPPKLSAAQQQQLVEAQTVFDISEQVYGDTKLTKVLTSGMHTFAFPHYRLVFRLKGSNDSDLGFVDATRLRRYHPGGFMLLPPAPGRGRIDREQFPGQELSSGRSDFSHENLDFTEPPLTRTVYDEEAHGAIDSMLLEALRKSPISANTWNDPTIFPIVNEMPTKSTVGGNVYTVLAYIMNSSTRNPRISRPTRPPSYLEIGVKQPLISQHLKSEAAPTRRRKPQNPAAEGAPRPNIRLESAQQNIRRSREKLLRERMREALAHQAKLGSNGSNNGPSAVEPSPPEVVVTDKKGYYKTLGISPKPEYVSEAARKTSDIEIKLKYYDLVMVHHPDRFSTPTEIEQAHARTQELNIAYSKVETLELRRKYL